MACMVMERSESDLLSFMHNTYGGPSPVPLHVAKHLCYQILLGLQHCHGNNVIHRDLKPANVLVHQNTNGLLVLKIADFGLSRQLNSPIPGFTFRCTRWYRAPEVFLKTIEDSAAVDVWAAGCIFLEMILGYAPFRGNAERETLFAIFSVLGTPNNTTWPGVEELPNWRGLPHWERKNLGTAFRWPQGGVPNPLAIDLMGKMLILNPEHRIDCLDALKHQYFDDIRSNYMSPDLAHVTESEWTTRFNGRLG